VNWKRFTKDAQIPLLRGGDKVDGVDALKRDKNGTIAENMIIKGNNLLAMHSLKKQFAGKVKLIYIDPPYNTGNDGFKYNDNFNHSTWLTFMKNRLEVARELLREDGVIFVQCDDNEQAYLKVLMDEVFGRENFVGDLIRKTKSVTNDAKVGFNIQHENTLIFARKKVFLKLSGTEKDLSNYSNPDNDPNGDWVSSDPSARTGNTKFEIKNPYTGKIDLPPNGRCWAFSKESFERHVKSGKIVFKKEIKNGERGFVYKRYKNELKDLFNLLNSLDGADNRYMNQVATKEKNDFIEYEFEYPKPEDFLKLIIQSSTQPGDIVLDYHLGSGTTAAVAHKMGRQYIGIEQMEYVETIAVERLKKVIGQYTSPAKESTTQEENSRKLTAKERQGLQEILEKIKNSNNSLV
jgi:adenine-specific DNA-methyltransferase